MSSEFDIISAEEANTLAGLFRERIRRSPNKIAYRFYDALNETWSGGRLGVLRSHHDEPASVG